MATSSTQAETRLTIRMKENAPMPLGAYSHAVRVGPWVYLCGMGARDGKTGEEVGLTRDPSGNVTGYDIERQTRQVIENVKTVLAECDCVLEDLVDVTVYLADMKDFAAYNKIYAEYFSFENPPARTTVEARPPGLNFIEIKAIAYKAVQAETVR